MIIFTAKNRYLRDPLPFKNESVILFLLVFLIWSSSVFAGNHEVDLTELTLEDLINLDVTSVSRKAQKISEASAAVYVITSEDISRSGFTSIADILRTVPGMYVGGVNANTWGVSSRGFNGVFSNKLLVLIDGRSVYTPLFSGVFWDVQDVVLEDIERIEVIRGPGGTLWGANAVNGVINIITKRAGDTQGGYIKTGIGTEDRAFGTVQYGGRFGKNLPFRFYWKYFERDNSADSNGNDWRDKWELLRAGCRIDWEHSSNNFMTLQGDAYRGRENGVFYFSTITPPYLSILPAVTRIAGGNVLGRWIHAFSASADMMIQAYFDRTERYDPRLDEVRNTFDLDFQSRWSLHDRIETIWGFGYRLTGDEIVNSPCIELEPAERTDHLYTAFVQTDFEIVKNRFRLTLGSKFENNSYTGFEFQPGIRCLWTPHRNHTVWSSVTRAVRTPSRIEHDGEADWAVSPPNTALNPYPLPVKVFITGNEDYESEVLYAYEIGYRIQPADNFMGDIALFYNEYEKLLMGLRDRPVPVGNPPTYMLLQLEAGNDLKGDTYGFEMISNWFCRDWLRLNAVYSFLEVDLDTGVNDNRGLLRESEGYSPRNQVSVRMMFDIPHDITLDIGGRYVDRIPDLNIDSYFTLDGRIGWRIRSDLELAVVGLNLLDGEHYEFIPEYYVAPSQVQRSVYTSVALKF